MKVSVSDKEQVSVGHGDVADEWVMAVGDREYVRKKYYEIDWKRKGVKAGNGKYPDEEIENLLEALFRSSESTRPSGTFESEEG